MAPLFDPDVLHDIAKETLGTPTDQLYSTLARKLEVRYPGHINHKEKWLFNNAGGAMGAMALFHCSLTEYIILFGTPIGTTGHSGRYRSHVYDAMLEGEMWCYHPGSLKKTIYQPGDMAHLGPSDIKGYRVPDGAWMLEYAQGFIPQMLPFGLADTLFSTLDWRTVAGTMWQYGTLTVRELLKHGKI